MERTIDKEIKELKNLILKMQDDILHSLDEAIFGLTKNDRSYFKKVYEREVQINDQHLQIDQQCLEVMARRSPLANQLRQIIGVIKINNELERVGDQVVNICRSADIYIQRPPLKPLIDIPRMSEEASKMLKDAINSFVTDNMMMAFDVIRRDDNVDALHDQILRELFTYMGGNTQNIEQALSLIFISKNLERLADHVASIAEHTVFCVSGQDVRHIYDRKVPDKQISILFLCVHNSARSQMAEGLAKNILGDKFKIHSAGTDPTVVNPFAVHVLREKKIDISKYISKNVNEVDQKNVDFVITLCEQEVCPQILLKSSKRLHWDVEDPVDTFDSFRKIRDEIETHIKEFNNIFFSHR